MHTNENKKKKPAGQWGEFTTGRGMIVFILPSMPAHSHAIKICQHFPTRPPAFTLMPCCVLPACRIHAERSRCQHFQRSRRVFTAALRCVDRSRSPADTRTGCSHVHMCPTGVVIVGGLADSSAMGSCVHCIQSGVYESEA